MPRARRSQPAEAAQTEEVRQDAATQDSQAVADTPAPAEEAETAVQDGQAVTDAPTPTEEAETAAQDEQAVTDAPTLTDEAEAAAQDEQAAGDTPAPAEEAEATAQPRTSQGTYQLGLTVRIKGGDPSEDIVATADVDLGNICTIRNVKIKEDDYGLKVVMPRTKLPETGRFKDACYFHSVEARVQFDRAVLQSYEQSQALGQESGQSAQEQDGMGGMTM